jgi:Zn-dependent protease/CBS domain-containing protein
MFRTRWRLFRLAGIPINVDASWLIVLALITWTLASFFERELPHLTEPNYWLMGLVTALIFFTCIVLHELGHALVAQRLGIPLRGITLFLFGGVAELEGEPTSAGREFLMAIAGPLVSAVLAALFWGLAGVGADAGWDARALAMLNYLAAINALVLAFNLIPAFPLDGGRVFRSILWGTMGNLRRATHWAALLGQGFAWVLIALGILHFFQRDVISGVWLGLIGLFLHNAAQSSYQQLLTRQALQGEPVRRFMNPDPIVVPPSLDLRHWVEEYVYRFHHKMFPVVADGRLEGVISTEALTHFPRDEWDFHTIAEAMWPSPLSISLPPNADALQALDQMRRTGSSRLLVTEGDHLLGMVSLKDLLRFLELKLEVESANEENRRRPPAWRPSGQRETEVPSSS